MFVAQCAARCYRLIESEITCLQKGLLGLYLGKKKRLRHLTSRNIYAHVNIKNTSKNSHKRICSFVLFFALVLVPSIAQERFLNSESSLSCLQIFLIHWSLNMFCASAEVTHLHRCTKHIEGPSILKRILPLSTPVLTAP